MSYFHTYIYLIVAVKFLFMIMVITHLYLKATGKAGSEFDNTLVYWKERFEFVFVFLMSILLIYLFNPRHDRSIMIDHHTKILLYVFGFVLLITAKWSTFFSESSWFKDIQHIVGEE